MARSRYKKLVDSLAAQIRAGQLAPGTRLPTHRELAVQERIALVTASRIYAELAIMGLVSGEAGRGTFVRELALPPGHGVDQQTTAAEMLDLNFNYPALPEQTDLFRSGLRQLASAGDLDALLRYQPHAGRPHERAAVAQYLACRGLAVTAQQVLIVSGAQHGLAASVMALLDPGDVVAVDSLSYPGFKALAEAQRLELLPIPVTHGGKCAGLQPDLESLAVQCTQRRVRAIYAMPTLHNPLGWVLSLAQRRRLVAIARKHDLLIIEDAAYAFLADAPPAPLAALAPERTLYVSGFSKSLATGLRVGYVVAPTKWVPQLERVIRVTTWNTPGLMTALVCDWLADGSVARMEAQKREDAAKRQAMARQILKELHCVGHSASYFLWLPLPAEVRADQVVMGLLRAKVAVSSAEPFAISERVPHAIRLALGSVALPMLEVALRQVARVIYACSCGVTTSP
ncbi:MAG: PLP-dependent aminotransferase family protein [Halopseudomonas sp.]|uniref:aminotransferase-like domain-containing protein n=1 Tax=Halopseudomonas sp. TaxID=2901191 RepID=UPI0030034384